MEITNAKKGSDDYLMDWTDYIIGSLVREKLELYKAYNYYNGVRDHYQYENLEKNYGVGNPTSVGFTPLTRKHIDAIVGEYLTKLYTECNFSYESHISGNKSNESIDNVALNEKEKPFSFNSFATSIIKLLSLCLFIL